VPEQLRQGITFEGVSFAYPGTTEPVLRDVDLTLPAGAVVAIVGENGAGKTTLVKLLSKFYRPTRGRILVDGVDLDAMPAEEWRSRLAGAYQDFFRFELRAQHTVGVGDVPRLDHEPAVVTAVTRAGADDVVDRLEAGLDTQLGPAWPGGVDVSFGQWQKLALARGFMRDEPLVLVLDEPTAALDAETEHALFERYAAGAPRGERARAHRDPGVAPLLHGPHGRPHRGPRRLPGGRGGSHDELMARPGTYADLYGIQATAYR
jgi:ATP-binding cassette subfamily B protein